MFSFLSPFKKSSSKSTPSTPTGSSSPPSTPSNNNNSTTTTIITSGQTVPNLSQPILAVPNSPPSSLSSSPSSSAVSPQRYVSTSNDINILFLTHTICPICSFVEEGKGLEKEHWKEGLIVKKGDDIWLVIKCLDHGDQEIKICSSFDFFMKTLDYAPDIMETKSNFNIEIEELEKQIQNDATIIENTPLMVDLDVFCDEQFIPDDIIIKSIYDTMNLIPKEKNVIIRVNGKLVEDIVTLNKKLNLVLEYIPDENAIVLELSVLRIVQLSQLNDTCLLNPRIHPSIQIFVQKGFEKETAVELNNTFNALKQITNLTIIVRIVVSRPFPRLDAILNLLRFPMKGFCRFIIIETERTPSQIMKQFKSSTSHYNENDEAYNVDPLELLKLIEEDTKEQIRLEDFFPASVGVLLEPFLSMLGKGNFNIRPSPFCGFATCLINSENQQTYPSVPVSRLIDVEKLFKEMVPIVKNMKTSMLSSSSGSSSSSSSSSGTSSSSQDISFFQYRALKKALEKARKPQSDYPLPKDLFSYLISRDPTMTRKTRQIIEDLQFLIVHNVMDVGTLDLVRRTRCTLCKYQPGGKGFVSSCTNCI
nr:unnamed protein product [Naegleria fowleri]